MSLIWRERESGRDLRLSLPIVGVLLLGVLELSRYSFSSKIRLEIVENQRKCIRCGKGGKLEAHHVCFESIAKYFKVQRMHYDHPANGVSFCHDCHVDFHQNHKNFTYVEKFEMVYGLYERIIAFHEAHEPHELRELKKEHRLKKDPNFIYNQAEKALQQMNRKWDAVHQGAVMSAHAIL